MPPHKICCFQDSNGGTFFDQWDRKKLFCGWILGPIHCNALAFLPLINASQRQSLQVALNAGVRAVANIPPYGHANLTKIREKLGIPNILQITEKVILSAAWKQRAQFQQANSQLDLRLVQSQTETSLSQYKKGFHGNLISTAIACGWNRLPITIKNEDSSLKARLLIKNHISHTV